MILIVCCCCFGDGTVGRRWKDWRRTLGAALAGPHHPEDDRPTSISCASIPINTDNKSVRDNISLACPWLRGFLGCLLWCQRPKRRCRKVEVPWPELRDGLTEGALSCQAAPQAHQPHYGSALSARAQHTSGELSITATEEALFLKTFTQQSSKPKRATTKYNNLSKLDQQTNLIAATMSDERFKHYAASPGDNDARSKDHAARTMARLASAADNYEGFIPADARYEFIPMAPVAATSETGAAGDTSAVVANLPARWPLTLSFPALTPPSTP